MMVLCHVNWAGTSNVHTAQTSATSCIPCVAGNGALCLMGAPVPVALAAQFPRHAAADWRLALMSDDPVIVATAQADTTFATLQFSFLMAMAGSVGAFAVYIAWSHRTDAAPLAPHWLRVDFFFSAMHHTPHGESVRVFPSHLGGMCSVLAILLILILGALLGTQNFLKLSPQSTVTTARVPFNPLGLYSLTIIIYGGGLQAACATTSNSSALSLRPTQSAAWLRGSAVVTRAYSSSDGSCRISWICSTCQMSDSVSSPQFVLQSTVASWATLFVYKFTAPVPVAADGVRAVTLNYVFSSWDTSTT
jgi:hypothetical protein